MQCLFCCLWAVLKKLRNHTPSTLYTISSLVFVLIMLSSCHYKERVQPKPHWFKHYTHYNEKDYIQYIENQIESENDSTLTVALTRAFYCTRNHHPFWTQKGLQEALTDTLLASLDNAYRLHGIPAEYFGLDSIRHSISQLVEHQVPNDNSLYSHLYCLERQLTEQYLRYVCALQYGAVVPKSVHGNKWYYATLSPDSVFI